MGCVRYVMNEITDKQIVSEAHASGAHGVRADRTLTLGGSVFMIMGVPTHDDCSVNRAMHVSKWPHANARRLYFHRYWCRKTCCLM